MPINILSRTRKSEATSGVSTHSNRIANDTNRSPLAKAVRKIGQALKHCFRSDKHIVPNTSAVVNQSEPLNQSENIPTGVGLNLNHRLVGHRRNHEATGISIRTGDRTRTEATLGFRNADRNPGLRGGDYDIGQWLQPQGEITAHVSANVGVSNAFFQDDEAQTGISRLINNSHMVGTNNKANLKDPETLKSARFSDLINALKHPQDYSKAELRAIKSRIKDPELLKRTPITTLLSSIDKIKGRSKDIAKTLTNEFNKKIQATKNFGDLESIYSSLSTYLPKSDVKLNHELRVLVENRLMDREVLDTASFSELIRNAQYPRYRFSENINNAIDNHIKLPETLNKASFSELKEILEPPRLSPDSVVEAVDQHIRLPETLNKASFSDLQRMLRFPERYSAEVLAAVDRHIQQPDAINKASLNELSLIKRGHDQFYSEGLLTAVENRMQHPDVLNKSSFEDLFFILRHPGPYSEGVISAIDNQMQQPGVLNNASFDDLHYMLMFSGNFSEELLTAAENRIQDPKVIKNGSLEDLYTLYLDRHNRFSENLKLTAAETIATRFPGEAQPDSVEPEVTVKPDDFAKEQRTNFKNQYLTQFDEIAAKFDLPNSEKNETRKKINENFKKLSLVKLKETVAYTKPAIEKLGRPLQETFTNPVHKARFNELRKLTLATAATSEAFKDFVPEGSENKANIPNEILSEIVEFAGIEDPSQLILNKASREAAEKKYKNIQ